MVRSVRRSFRTRVLDSDWCVLRYCAGAVGKRPFADSFPAELDHSSLQAKRKRVTAAQQRSGRRLLGWAQAASRRRQPSCCGQIVWKSIQYGYPYDTEDGDGPAEE